MPLPVSAVNSIMVISLILAGSVPAIGLWLLFARGTEPTAGTCPSCGQWESHKMWCPNR